eukprot:PhF_6_TR29195/c0_g1_i1/m.42716/K11687/ADPRHL2; poly(ADP-ribose) glycohydrolase ARH3
MHHSGGTDWTQKRVSGLLLGLAAGDRNGGPQRMALRVCQCLLTHPNQPLPRNAIIHSYLEWCYPSDPKCTDRAFDTGAVFDGVFRRVHRQGETVDVAARAVFQHTGSAGVNGAHRNVVLSLAPWLSTEDGSLQRAATEECTITHIHPESVATSVATNLIARRLILGDDPRTAIEQTLGETTDETMLAVLKGVLQGKVNESYKLHSGGHSPYTLQTALHFLLYPPPPDNHNVFQNVLSASLSYAGEPNFCPVLVGALAGAWRGSEEVVSSNMLNHRYCQEPMQKTLSDVAN